MNHEQFIAHIEESYRKGVDLVRKKNQDYGNPSNPWLNFEMARLVGVPIERAILIRMSDKLARVSNLLEKEPSVAEEKIEDSLLDLANYAVILMAYLDDQKGPR